MYNFSEHTIQFPAHVLRDVLGEHAVDHVAGSAFSFGAQPVVLDPYRALWLTAGTGPLA